MNLSHLAAAFAALVFGAHAVAQTPPIVPMGELKGTAWTHSPESLAATLRDASVVLPVKATGGAVFTGKYRDIPALKGERVPVVLFLHGSSGLGLKAIGEWQQWLATLGVASMAPDSFALPDRVTYSSPIDKDAYEKLHALRSTEIVPALAALKSAPWADPARLILAGASEGGVPQDLGLVVAGLVGAVLLATATRAPRAINPA